MADELCRLGYCAKHKAQYQGAGGKTTEQLRKGICPICGGPMDKKYFQKG